MNFDCPYCREKLNLLEVLHESDLATIIALAASFGGNFQKVRAYCYLFGTTPLHLKATKLRILLEEMKRLFDSETFTFEKRSYAISRSGIVEALDIMVKRNWSKPLPNHNYSKQIMISISEREGKGAGIEAEKDLRKKEAGLMSGSRDAYPVPAEHVLPPMKSIPPLHLTEEQIAENKRKTRELLKSIGG